MNMDTKPIRRFAVAAAILFGLAACSPAPVPDAPTPQGGETESVTLPLVVGGTESAGDPAEAVATEEVSLPLVVGGNQSVPGAEGAGATQSVSMPLVVSGSDTVPNPAIPAGSLVSSPNVEEISQTAGWQVKVPAWLPEGYQLNNATYDSANQIVLLTFLATRPLPGSDPTMTETKAITLVQALRNDLVPLMVAPSTNVQTITVNGQPAAYAVGAWQADAATGQSTWTNDYPLQNVYWQTAPVYLNLNTDDAQVSQEDLIRMAESTN